MTGRRSVGSWALVSVAWALAGCGPAGAPARPVPATSPRGASRGPDVERGGPGTYLLAMPAAACDPAGPSLRPPRAEVAPGGTRQFAVSPPAPVTWSVTGEPAGGAAAAFPLRISADRRHLVDAGGRPWRIQADAAWLMSTNATPAQVDAYLSTRRAQGFDAFYLMAVVHPGGYAAAPHAPDDAAGDHPFAVPGDFTTAGADDSSRRYWAWIDSIVDRAAARGMAVMLAYDYLGYGGGPEGWASVVSRMSPEAATAWGRWLGERYREKGNVVWLHAGDYTPPRGSALEARVVAIVRAIRAAGAVQPAMAEVSGGDGIPSLASPALAAADPLMMNSFYGYGRTGFYECNVEADLAYGLSPPRPAWVQEGGYEEENVTGRAPADTGYATRRTRLWSTLAGGTAGDGFGSARAWQWKDFPAGLATPGAANAAAAFRLFASLPWWDLRPSGLGPGYAGRRLITAGAGTWGSQDAAVAAATPDGSWLLAYVPGTSGGTAPSSVTVDLRALAGPARARWWNPGSGAYTELTGGRRALPNSGTRAFTTPGANGAGANDWVLVLDAAGPGCGSVSPAGLYRAPPVPPSGVTCGILAASRTDPRLRAAVLLELR